MAHVGTPATGVLGTSSSSITVTLTSGVPVGHTLIIGVAAETSLNSPANTFSASDTKNTYTPDATSINSTTVGNAILSTVVTVALNSGDTIVISSNHSHNRWAASVEEFDDILTSPVDKSATTTGVSTSLTSTATATTTAANELVFGSFGFSSSGQTVTAGSGYTKSTVQVTSAGSSERAISNEWQYVNSTGAQTATATLSASRTWSGAVVTYKSQAVGNSAPTANAGVDQSVAAQQLVKLDGTASTDSDGTIAAYSWSQISGTAVTLSSTTATQPTFIAPTSGSGATLVFGLVVTDNAGADSTQDTVQITVAAAVGHVATPVAGSASSGTGTSASSHAFTVSQAVVAGHYLLVSVLTEWNNGATQPLLSLADSKSNTYTLDNYVAVSATLFLAVFSCRLTTALTTSDTLTISDSATQNSRWAISAEEYDNLVYPGAPLDQIISSSGHATALTTTATATTVTANELIFAAFGYSVPSAQTFTVGSGYTASTQQATSSGSSDRALSNEWRYVNATGTQTATGTVTTITNYGALALTYKSINITGNNIPTANAGPDQAVTISTTVTLDGSGSADTDGTIASYTWRQISGTSVSLSSTSAQKPTFTAPGTTSTLVFGLIVTDNNGASSAEDTITVLVGSHAGYVAEAVFGTSTTSSTTFVLHFNKNVSAGHTILIGMATDTANSDDSFTATDARSNTYVLDAHVTDGSHNTVTNAVMSAYISNAITSGDSLTITANHTHSRWAVSGSEFDNIVQNGKDVSSSSTNHSTTPSSGTTGSSVSQYEVVFGSVGFSAGSSQTLTANSGYALTTQLNNWPGTSNRSVANMYKYFSASTTYTAGGTLSATSTWGAAVVSYGATSLGNLAPTANAGSNQSVAPFAVVTLNGTASSDPDGVISSYSWTQTAGPTVTLSSSTAASPTFTSPGVDGGTTLTFSLTVTDNSSTSSNPSTVTISVSSATEFALQSGAWVAAQVYAAQSGSWV